MTRRPRREPQQVRSRETVERLLDAAREVLLRRGWDGATTNHIAAAAGVGPGSFYQYFADKEAILSRVVDREVERLETRISRAFVATLQAPPGELVRSNVEALLDAFGENPGLTRILVEQMPRGPGSRRASFARRIDELVATVLATQGIGDRRADVVAWVLVRAVEQVTTSHALEEPGFPRDDVVAELTLLVTRYLDDRSAPARGSAS